MSDSSQPAVVPAPVAIVTPDPVPVAIVTPDPVPVTVVGETSAGKKIEAMQPQGSLPSKPAETTFQQDLTLAGQRNINVMWETTQRNVTLLVTWGGLLTCGYLIVMGPTDLKLAAFTLLSSTVSLVIGTYYQRTNHTKTGGVGSGDTGR